jgi:hypothetical protein
VIFAVCVLLKLKAIHSENVSEHGTLRRVFRLSPWARGEDLGEGSRPHRRRCLKEPSLSPLPWEGRGDHVASCVIQARRVMVLHWISNVRGVDKRKELKMLTEFLLFLLLAGLIDVLRRMNRIIKLLEAPRPTRGEHG